jgi:flagellar biosynthesis/type III secretory pathway chaperone
LDQYDEEVKSKLRAAKKVYHDERRAKELAAREREEAISVAQKILEENKKLKARLTQGEQIYADTAKDAAERALAMAQKEFREAYDAGDGDALAAAQQKVTEATMSLRQANSFKPSLQEEEKEVEIQPKRAEPPKMDEKTSEWMSKNPWFGSPRHKAMSSFAYGLHEELLDEYGSQFVGSDDYFKRIDKKMRRTFPEYFTEEGEEAEETKPSQQRAKAAPIVAPASRSTASKKVKLKQSQLAVVKKLGITPEQYAREFLKLEN